MSLREVMEVLSRVRASLVLPMHFWGYGSLERFLAGLGTEFQVRLAAAPTIRISQAALPKRPTVMVVPLR